MNPDLFLVILIIIGLIGRSPIISTAASLLLILKLTHLERFFPTVERRGLELGLLFLTIAVLVPFAAGRISVKEITSMFTSLPGILAIIGGMLATYMNGKGLDLLKMDPQLIIGLVIGSIIGIVMLRGIPVGPLMAAGITAFLLKVLTWIWSR
ncbi:MAG: DUF441 domain-containing protein [Thermoactinomycetaceae bacterium]|jgi:uncharacterized membrane protein (DUF441 family)|nr:DUF441 domain-containing protein [Planifilum fulgidum]MBO2497946.1 DUF441 domain-containing protein [Bacillota bacterium]MBO2533491.1 DUF441 domain-containing protein [Thermoactinomycetaceae bacterium]